MSLKILRGVNLSAYTTFKIGGPADYLVRVRSINSLKAAVESAYADKLPFFVIGGGSNLLISDRGVRGMAIINRISGIRINNCIITVRSGEKLSRLVDSAISHNLEGLEFLSGIPGTVGGAVYGNAGAYGRAAGDLLVSAIIMDGKGRIREVEGSYFSFSYRRSRLKETGEIIISACFKLTPGDGERLRLEKERIIRERQSKHPDKTWGCAGSFFKNIDPPSPDQRRIAAGLLLDQAGVRGMKMGKAMVFPGHANFITNPGGATAEEILKLSSLAKEKVKEKFGITLEEEVLYIDEFLTGAGKFAIPCPGGQKQ